MSKLIIDNCSTADDSVALMLVCKVLAEGKISETAGKKHHCHMSLYVGECEGREANIAIYCRPNYKSEKFTVMNYRGE